MTRTNREVYTIFLTILRIKAIWNSNGIIVGKRANATTVTLA
jgi:hypothetical protein